MRGIPPGLDLRFLLGAEVVQLCFGRHQLQARFHPEACLSVEGRWELEDESGRVIARGSPGPEGEPCRLLGLLGRRVVGTQVAAPASFTLNFDGGLKLRVFDSSSEYESFSIEPGGIFV